MPKTRSRELGARLLSVPLFQDLEFQTLETSLPETIPYYFRVCLLFVSLKVSYFFITEKGEDRNKLIGKVQDEVVHALKIIHYLS